jgi:GT2 family glycosyltransferase
MSKKLSVVIPSRNGLSILRKYLPVILREAAAVQAEVIVVDDCSDDGTSEKLPAMYAEVTVLKRTGTPGFCHAVNLGMSTAAGSYLMLLNNDTVPSENSFRRLLEELEQSEGNVAVVVPSIIRPDGSDDGSFRWAFSRGLAVTGENVSGEDYPSGACAVWKRSVWEELEGFSTAYAPIYWEDTDLGVRMHRAGYSMKRNSDIVIEHAHAATMGSSIRSETLRERNRFIFMERNCNTAKQRNSQAVWLPVHLAVAFVSGNRAFINGYRDYRNWKREIS